MLLPSHSYYDIILKDHNKVRSVSHKVYYNTLLCKHS